MRLNSSGDIDSKHLNYLQPTSEDYEASASCAKLTTVQIAHITPVCCGWRAFTAAIAHNFLKLHHRNQLAAHSFPERPRCWFTKAPLCALDCNAVCVKRGLPASPALPLGSTLAANNGKEKDPLKILAQALTERPKHIFWSKCDGQELKTLSLLGSLSCGRSSATREKTPLV